jgi:glycosyltransferase involved in cell wall biosynthesis
MPRVVISHDFMEIYGGAERVTAELALAFPDAEVFSILGRQSVAERMGVADRFTSLMAPRPRLLSQYRMLTPAFPALIDAWRLPEADVHLSSSYAFVHGLRTVNNAPQVCYCHSPLRFAWSMTDEYREQRAHSTAAEKAFNALSSVMRATDRRSATRVDQYLTQSPYTATQIARFYGRPVEVVGAPVDTDTFHPSPDPPGDYFLLCARLIEPYKRVGVAIEAFRRLGLPLVIAGDGPAYRELSAGAPSNVEFVGHLDDDALVPLMQHCRAAIFPSRDDFGLIPVEVAACGRPVLAFAGGGALHTVEPGLTGEHFAEQTPDSLVEAMQRFDPESYRPAHIRMHAMQWARSRFRERVRQHVLAVAAEQR